MIESRKGSLFVVIVALLALVACSKDSESGAGDKSVKTPAAPAKGAARPPAPAVDERVTLIGTARDAKGGAMLVKEDGGTLYVKGLGAWPDELHGKSVSVTGIVRREKLIPDPKTDDAGAVSQGAFGDQTVIDEAAWKLAE